MPDGQMSAITAAGRLCAFFLLAFSFPPTLALGQVAPATLEPQPETRLQVSVTAGPFVPGDWSDLVVLGSLGPAGLVDRVVVRDLGPEAGTSADATLTYWRDRYGFRVHAGYAESCVATGSRCVPGAGGVDARTWLYDLGGTIGLRRYERGQIWRPYVFAGLGGITYDLDAPIDPAFLTAADREGPRHTGPLVLLDDSAEFLLAVEELSLESVLTAHVGVGADVRLPLGSGAIGLRFEAADHVARSPVALRLRSLEPRAGRALSDARVDFGAVHHFGLRAGIVLEFPTR